MSDLNITEKPDLPKEIVDKWQRIVNLMAKIIGIPAGLIMKVDPPEIEVFISSKTEGNPYHKGERANLNTGLYCEAVMQKRESLLVPDATKDPDWDHNPDIPLGMVYYLGFPIQWPDNQIFGTICVLDYKDNPKATNNKDLINEFKTIIETDLDNVLKKYELEIEKEKLRKSEEKYRLLAENAGDLIFVHDINGRIIYANKSGLEKTGYSLEDLPKLKIMDLVPREYKIILDLNIKERLKGDMSSKLYEIECLTKLGERMPLEVISTPFFIDEVLTFQVIARDMSERKKAENELKESEEKYRELVENANSIIVKFDKDGTVLSMNEFGLNFFEYTKDELIGKKWHETCIPRVESSGRILEDLINDIYLDMEKYAAHINENITKNGERVWINWSNKPIVDEKGNIKALLSVGTDITTRKKMEEALKESEERFRLFFEKANDPIFLVCDDDSIMDVNEAACNKFGYSKEEFLLLKIADIQAPERRGIPGNTIKSELEKYGGKSFEAIDVDKNGNRFYVEVVGTKLKLKGKDVILNISRDISERKRLEGEIKLLYNAIEQAPTIVVITDKTGLINYVNPKFIDLTGYKSSEVIGKTPRFLKTDFLPEEYYDNL